MCRNEFEDYVSKYGDNPPGYICGQVISLVEDLESVIIAYLKCEESRVDFDFISFVDIDGEYRKTHVEGIFLDYKDRPLVIYRGMYDGKIYHREFVDIPLFDKVYIGSKIADRIEGRKKGDNDD